jgi:hypothetical protein
MPAADDRGVGLLESREKLFKSGFLLPSSYLNDLYLAVFTKEGTSLSVKVTVNVELFME